MRAVCVRVRVYRRRNVGGVLVVVKVREYVVGRKEKHTRKRKRKRRRLVCACVCVCVCVCVENRREEEVQ